MKQTASIILKIIVGFCFISLILYEYFKFPINRKSKYQQSTLNKGISTIIHQSWKNHQISNRFKLYSKSWTENCFKNWTYMFWTDEDNLNLIANYYPWFLKTYENLPLSINKADVSRYFYLFHFGGIYTDLDNECLRSFEHLLQNYSLVFGAMEGQYGGTSLQEGYVQNSFMYSRPRHEFWIELIVEIMKISGDKNLGGVPEALTGPITLSNTIKTFRERHLKYNTNFSMKIYSPEYFNPFSWLRKDKSNSHCRDFNKMSDNDWKICKSSVIAKGSYIVQYHAHTWG